MYIRYCVYVGIEKKIALLFIFSAISYYKQACNPLQNDSSRLKITDVFYWITLCVKAISLSCVTTNLFGRITGWLLFHTTALELPAASLDSNCGSGS